MEVDEPQLIHQFTLGNADAFAALYDLHSPAVHEFAWTILQDRDQTADAVQETFLTAWRRRTSIRLAAESLLPWLLATVRFVAMNELRRQARHPVRTLEGLEPVYDGVEAEAEMKVELQRVLRRIAALEALDQRILTLCILEGHTYDEAAKELHITSSSVGKRIERARRRLKSTDSTGRQ